MAISLCEVSITEAPLLSIPEKFPRGAGAVLDFWGVVRGQEEERQIDGLEYEAHRAMAEHQLRAVGTQALAHFMLTQIILRHRIGFVPAEEASLFVRVASSHRPAAFAAGQWIVEELKRRVPIWKHPIFSRDQASLPVGVRASEPERMPSVS